MKTSQNKTKGLSKLPVEVYAQEKPSESLFYPFILLRRPKKLSKTISVNARALKHIVGPTLWPIRADKNIENTHPSKCTRPVD